MTEQGYTIVTNRYGKDGPIPAEGCNYIEFINQGDNLVQVDGVTILPFGSWSPAPPLPGEVDYTQYRIKFTTPSTNKSLVVVQKFYHK